MENQTKFERLFQAAAAAFSVGEFADFFTQPRRDRRVVEEYLLPDRARKPAADTSPAALLRPEYQMVEFAFREDTQQEFMDWSDWSGNQLNKWRLVHGDTGRGKSRLLLEICATLRKTTGDNRWFAGIANTEVFESNPEVYEFLAQFPYPLFIVVDYAERQKSVAQKLLKMSRKRAENTGRYVTRIVFLTRKKTEIWDQLFDQDEELADVDKELLEEHHLKPVTEHHEISVIYESAFHSFKAHFGNEHEEPELEFSSFGNTVEYADIGLIHMIALIAAYAPNELLHGMNAKPEQDAVLNYLMKREMRHWIDMAGRNGLPVVLCDEKALTDAAILITQFAQDATILSASDARNILRGSDLLCDCSEAELNGLVELFRQLYPGEGHVNGVTPDLLGTHLVTNYGNAT